MNLENSNYHTNVNKYVWPGAKCYVLDKLMLILYVKSHVSEILNLEMPTPSYLLTLKAPINTAADDIYKYFFIVFQKK